MPISADIKKILKKYVKGGGDSQIITSRLMELNLYIKPTRISHDECLKWLYQEVQLSQRSKVINNFIYGIENSQPEYRAGLPAYSIAKVLPQHDYHGDEVYCNFCGAFRTQNIDLTLTNCARFLYGSLKTITPSEFALFLQLNTHLPAIETPKSDKLTEILIEIINSPQNENPTSLLKRISKIKYLNIPNNQIRGLLETLGYLGVLQTSEHPGYLHTFTSPYSQPAKSSRSDWRYPVDFWEGADGVNFEAIRYWFGDHLDITKLLIKSN